MNHGRRSATSAFFNSLLGRTAWGLRADDHRWAAL